MPDDVHIMLPTARKSAGVIDAQDGGGVTQGFWHRWSMPISRAALLNATLLNLQRVLPPDDTMLTRQIESSDISLPSARRLPSRGYIF